MFREQFQGLKLILLQNQRFFITPIIFMSWSTYQETNPDSLKNLEITSTDNWLRSREQVKSLLRLKLRNPNTITLELLSMKARKKKPRSRTHRRRRQICYSGRVEDGDGGKTRRWERERERSQYVKTVLMIFSVIFETLVNRKGICVISYWASLGKVMGRLTFFSI